MPDEPQNLPALAALDRQTVVPTTLRTALLQKLPPDLRRAAFFSAGVSKEPFLSAAQTKIRQIVGGLKKSEGGISPAYAREEMRRLAQDLGYGPGGTNAFDRPMTPDEIGGLTDLTSDARLNLIIDTNTSMARNAGWHESGQTADLLFAFPCAELVRAGAARHPRPWLAKWVAAGGRLYAGRMIARKDDPIWTKPLAAGGFNRFGNPFAPFDFNSHMEMVDISRREALRLGVITATDTPPAPAAAAALNLAAALAGGDLAELLRAALAAAGVNTTFTDGVLTLVSLARLARN